MNWRLISMNDEFPASQTLTDAAAVKELSRAECRAAVVGRWACSLRVPPMHTQTAHALLPPCIEAGHASRQRRSAAPLGCVHSSVDFRCACTRPLAPQPPSAPKPPRPQSARSRSPLARSPLARSLTRSIAVCDLYQASAASTDRPSFAMAPVMSKNRRSPDSGHCSEIDRSNSSTPEPSGFCTSILQIREAYLRISKMLSMSIGWGRANRRNNRSNNRPQGKQRPCFRSSPR